MTFKEFTLHFFERDNCPIQKRRTLKGYGWTNASMRKYRSELKTQFWVEFGKKDIQEISFKELDQYIIRLIQEKKYSEWTINSFIQTLKIIFGEAAYQRVIEKNITFNLDFIRIERNGRGILTTEETLKLFTTDGLWKSKKHKMFNLLACYTGMRLGELLAMTKDSITKKDGYYYVLVNKSWDPVVGMKETKTKTDRIVPLPSWVYEKLDTTIDLQANYLFEGRDKKPFTSNTVYRHLKSALDKIGIDSKEREKRNITFHSWRHRYISELTDEIPPEKLRLIVGHTVQETTENYIHQILEKTKKIIDSDFFKEE